MFHSDMKSSQVITFNEIIKKFILGSHFKMSNERAMQDLNLGGISLPNLICRRMALNIKRLQWTNSSPLPCVKDLAAFEKTPSCLEKYLAAAYPTLSTAELYKEALKRCSIKNHITTPTQKEYISLGLRFPLNRNLFTHNYPLTQRDIAWRIITKSLPLYHKNKNSSPYLESTEGFFSKTQEYVDLQNLSQHTHALV